MGVSVLDWQWLIGQPRRPATPHGPESDQSGLLKALVDVPTPCCFRLAGAGARAAPLAAGRLQAKLARALDLTGATMAPGDAAPRPLAPITVAAGKVNAVAAGEGLSANWRAPGMLLSERAVCRQGV